MSKVSYQAQLTVVAGDADIIRSTVIQSFSVTGGSSSKPIDLKSANDTGILAALEQARAKKNITLFKRPSKDDFDSVLIDMFQKKTVFGMNFEVYASYTGTAIQIVHFFGEDATISSQPTRVGGKQDLLLKVEISFPKADFKHAAKQNGKWVDDGDWIR